MRADSLFEIGNVRTERGQVARSFLQFGETATGPIQIPIIIIHGESDGPILCLTAGVHATEYAPIDAVLRIVNQLDPKTLRGTVIAVPVVSMHMFASRSGFVSPIDGLNLNKIAPGGDASISEILVRFLLDQVIARAQYHVDLHAGDLGEMLLAFGGYPMTQNTPLDRAGEALARLYTPELICLSQDGVNLPPFPGSIVYTATRMGVVSMLAESGGNGTMEEADTLVHISGIQNIMRYLKMIDGEPSIRGPQISATGREITRAKRAGLLRLKVKIGEKIADGQEVAEICDVFGRTVEVVRCVKGGIAGLIWAHKAVSTGDPIVRCWYTEAAAPFPETDRFMG
jgi:predicted deacylase